MNDAPTIAEAPPLDGKAIAELAEQLNQLLRLRTFPIGMKLFEDLDAMANVPGLRRPPKGRTFSTCQLVTQARMAGFTLGITTEPILSRVFMWDKAMPQYNLGHPEILNRIDAALENHPGLALAGNGYRGIGIPDCIHSGELAVDRVLTFADSNVETFQPANV